ncbi:MAG: hypothetical protein IT487_03575 [Chromatiaceae bacterium]|nr:hypothetical protein [Chromatiaceae bacterium]
MTDPSAPSTAAPATSLTDTALIIEVFHRAVTEVDDRMTEENRIGTGIARRTVRIIRGVLLLLAILAVINLYLIQDLARAMLDMTGTMDRMQRHFATVDRDMGTITQSVLGMNEQVRSLPPMKDYLVLMNQDMTHMNQDVRFMDQNLATMDQHVATITNGVGEMAGRFELLNQTTQGMGYNVNQMSQPVRTLDPFGFMGP